MSIKPCKSPLSYLKTASSESVCSRVSVCFLRGWCWLRRHGHNIKTDSIQRGRWGFSQSCILCSLLSLSYFRLFCVCFLFLAFCFRLQFWILVSGQSVYHQRSHFVGTCLTLCVLCLGLYTPTENVLSKEMLRQHFLLSVKFSLHMSFTRQSRNLSHIIWKRFPLQNTSIFIKHAGLKLNTSQLSNTFHDTFLL